MNADRRIPIVLVVVSLVLMLLVPMAGRAQTEPARLNDVTVTPQADSVTVFVKTSREAQYKADLVDSPTRLVIDLEDTVYAWRKTPLAVGKDPVKQIRGSQFRQGTARVVLDLTRTVGYAIREEPNGLAIVIPTAAPPMVAAAPAPAAPASGAPPAPAPAEPAPAATATAPAPAPTPAAPPARLAQATPAPPPAAPAPTNGQRLISFDFKDADVVNLLRILAAESNKNIVIGDDVKGKMSIALRNVPWDLALDIILETRGLRKIEKDGVMRIVSSEQLIKEREASARVEEARLKAESEVLAKGITIRAHKPTNSLFIRHYEGDLERIKKLIREKLDVPLPQVKIEARMEILDRDDLFALGVQWGGGGVLQSNNRSIVVGRGFTSQPSNQTAGTVPVDGVFGPPNLPAGAASLLGLLPISGLTGLPLGGNVVNLPVTSALGGG